MSGAATTSRGVGRAAARRLFVYSFCGADQEGLGRGQLSHATVSQHENVIGHLRDDREVVAHVHARDLTLADDAFERAQDFDLRRDVERRRRLVEDDDVGIGNQRHRGHQSLQLPAGHLMRVALSDRLRLRQRELAEQRNGLELRFRTPQRAMQARRLDHLIEDAARRVERRGGALRDVGDRATAQRTQLARRKRQDVDVADAHAAAGDTAAAARVAHQAQARSSSCPSPIRQSAPAPRQGES